MVLDIYRATKPKRIIYFYNKPENGRYMLQLYV